MKIIMPLQNNTNKMSKNQKRGCVNFWNRDRDWYIKIPFYSQENGNQIEYPGIQYLIYKKLYWFIQFKYCSKIIHHVNGNSKTISLASYWRSMNLVGTTKEYSCLLIQYIDRKFDWSLGSQHVKIMRWARKLLKS